MGARILTLSLGSFAVGTGAYVVTGVLVDIARELSVSVAAAGLLVTVFAVTAAVASPILVAATSGVPRKRLLVGALLLFASANAAAAVVPDLSLLLLMRVIAASGAAVFTPVASSVAASLAPPEMRGRALSVRTAGTTIALFVGVPVGTVVGGYFGWRTSFVLVSALAAVAAMGVGSLLPPTGTPARRGSLRHLGVARSGAVLGLMATFVVYTYMRPLIEALTSFGVGNVGLMLGLFGLASIPGTFLGGYAADRWGYGRSMAVILAVASLSLLLFSAVFVSEAGSVVAIVSTGVLLVLWSIATFMHFPLQQYRLIEVAPQEDQGTALSLNASAIWGGQGLGAGLGALILHYGSLVGLGLGGASCALVALAVLARQSGARRSSRTLRKTS